MTAIVAGLNSTPIHRLKHSWSEVKPKAMALFREVEGMVRSWKNLTEFRKAMTDVTGPCVPFLGMCKIGDELLALAVPLTSLVLGVYLTALLFIQNGIKDTLDTEGKIINFTKHARAAETVTEIQGYQAVHYNLSIVPSIRLFIDKSLLVTATPNEFWELSLAREPRDSVPDGPSERRWLLMSSFVVF
jgi:son of sevenless